MKKLNHIAVSRVKTSARSASVRPASTIRIKSGGGVRVTARSGRRNGKRVTTHPETHLQIQAVKLFDTHVPKGRGFLFSLPQWGARSVREGAILKSMGNRAGVYDLVLLTKDRTAVFIEAKRPESIDDTLFGKRKVRQGVLSDSQKAFKSTVESFGFPCREFRSLTDFITILKEFGVL